MSNKIKSKQIAELAHETNRIYCRLIGDNTQPRWGDAPEWQRQSAVKGVEFHLSHLARGIKPSPSASHDAWLEEKRQTGWKFGPVKDAAKKEHPCFVPYEELPLGQRLKDYLFAAIVEAAYEAAQTKLVGALTMKKLICTLCFALFSASAFAGIFRESAKVTYRGAKVASYPARHPKKSAKASLHAAKKSARKAAHIAY